MCSFWQPPGHGALRTGLKQRQGWLLIIKSMNFTIIIALDPHPSVLSAW
jgi:hypothetical protein